MARLPHFLVIGAQKSGTSWLYRELRSHPEIFMPEKKELHFFNQRLIRRRSLKWYQAWFRDAPDSAVRGEATPAYLFHPRAPYRISRVLPEARLIAILRDPADRAFSQWRMLTSKGIVDPSTPFLEAFHRGTPRQGSMRDRGFYATQLERYFGRFPAQQVKVFLYDDLMTHPADLLQQAHSFLGVDEGFLSTTYLDRYPTSYRNFSEVPHEVSPDERKELVQYYRDSVEKLEDLLGRDLASWKE